MVVKKGNKTCNSILMQEIVSHLRDELTQENSHHRLLGSFMVPDRFFNGLPEDQIQSICHRINEIADLPLILGRHLKCTPDQFRKLPRSLQQKIKWQLRNRINAAIVHLSLKAPLSKYKGSYVLGFGDTNDVNIFVAKVTDVHLNSCIIPNIQSEAEVSLSVEFYADESGLIHVPTEPLFIRRERCDLEFLFGKLTKEQLASLKQALEREGGELCYRLAQF